VEYTEQKKKKFERSRYTVRIGQARKCVHKNCFSDQSLWPKRSRMDRGKKLLGSNKKNNTQCPNVQMIKMDRTFSRQVSAITQPQCEKNLFE
jgi:hypothetical protein